MSLCQQDLFFDVTLYQRKLALLALKDLPVSGTKSRHFRFIGLTNCE